MGVVSGISEAEGQLNADMAAAAGNEAAENAVKTGFVAKIQGLMEDVTSGSMVAIGIWIVVILFGCFIAVWLLIHFGYKIDEKRHLEIVQELEKRHAEVGFDQEELEEEGQVA